MDLPAATAICLRHHFPLHRSCPPQVPRGILGNRKPPNAGSQGASHDRLFPRLRISAEWLAADRGPPQASAGNSLRANAAGLQAMTRDHLTNEERLILAFAEGDFKRRGIALR
mgnify:FL=1